MRRFYYSAIPTATINHHLQAINTCKQIGQVDRHPIKNSSKQQDLHSLGPINQPIDQMGSKIFLEPRDIEQINNYQPLHIERIKQGGESIMQSITTNK